MIKGPLISSQVKIIIGEFIREEESFE